VERNFAPLVPSQRTIQKPGFVKYGNTKWYADKRIYMDLKAAVIAALREAGRGDQDWRCVIYRWCEETYWGTSCFNYNIGNIHAHPWATRESILSGYVWSDAGADGMTIIRDDGEIVGEYAFSGLASWLRYEGQWLQRNGYQGALDGMRAGGIEGLMQVCQAEMSRGYAAHTTVAEDQHAARNYWAISLHAMGADWGRE
jgi:hypothetical protein